jgi:CPA2 family monovalent cation:H+ antiporter-2
LLYRAIIYENYSILTHRDKQCTLQATHKKAASSSFGSLPLSLIIHYQGQGKKTLKRMNLLIKETIRHPKRRNCLMPHDVNLIATIAAGFGLAMIFGLLAARLKMPPLIGYLVAGILIGPATPGFVADMSLAMQLAEIGVMLLMFGVGLHFSLADLMAVKRIAIPGAIAQIGVAVLFGSAIAIAWGWELLSAILFGLCLSVASTVVLLRALEAKGILKSMTGQIAMGWLIVEDLVMILVLVLLPTIAGITALQQTDSSSTASHPDLWAAVGWTLTKVSAFIALMLIAGRRILPRLLWMVARLGSRELFTLTVLACALGVAFGAAKLFDVSFALGAFFAGMMMRESELSHRAAEESLPLRDAFAVLFFVSVGMLFEPSVIWTQPVKLLLVVLTIVVGKTLAAIAIVLLFRYSLNTALTVGASLAQIGEFSFILAGLAISLNLLPAEGQSLILAGAFISIGLNTALFSGITPLHSWLLKKSAFARKLELRDDPLTTLPMSTPQSLLTGQVVLVGYGRVGQSIALELRQHNLSYIVADENREVVEILRSQGVSAVSGDATTPEVLIQAHIVRAAMLVVATPDTLDVRKMVQIARTLNPTISVVLTAHNEEEARLLEADNLGTVFLAERELSKGMTHFVLEKFGIQHH